MLTVTSPRPGQTKQEERELAELDKGSMLLRKDLEKLCKLKMKNKERNETLELENLQMETDFRNKLKAWHGCLIVVPCFF